MNTHDNLAPRDIGLGLQAQAISMLQIEQALRHLQGHLPVDSIETSDLLHCRLRCELLRHSIHQLSRKLLEPDYVEGANIPSDTAMAATGACGTDPEH